MSGDKRTQLEWIQTLQNESESSLFFMQDAEWGPAMRLTDVTPFPKNLTLGAIQGEELLLEAGRGIAREVLSTGIHMNLAPVCDVNLDPANPIIGMRSLGDDPEEVARKVALLTRGMREMGLLTCAKHFPGHGNTKVDSHRDLPVMTGSEEYPSFQASIDSGVDAVMVGHLLFPEMDDLPASLSKKIIEGELRQNLGFDGLVLPDSLCMRALTNYYSPDEIIFNALDAGCDLLLFASAQKAVVDLILHYTPLAIENLAKTLSEEEVDQKLSRLPPLPNNPPATCDEEQLKRQLYRAALTEVSGFNPKAPCVEVTRVTKELIEFLRGVNVQLILYCSPYELAKLPPLPALVAYEDNPWTREAVQDCLEGKLTPSGKLPIRL